MDALAFGPVFAQMSHKRLRTCVRKEWAMWPDQTKGGSCMGRKPTSKRDVDHRALAMERDEIPFDGDNPKHTGIMADTSKLSDDEVNGNPLYWRERIRRARGVAFDDTAKVAFLEALRLSRRS
jgi:hypothetical protein